MATQKTVYRLLRTSKFAQAAEIAVVFLVGLALIAGARPFVGENPLAFHGLVWVANIVMLLTVWWGLRLRAQDCGHFGLRFRRPDRPQLVRTVLQSLAVFACAVAAFVAGAIGTASLLGVPETADMSGFRYLRGNLPLLLLSLPAVYLVSSFGEEVLYRGFLINRIAEIGTGSRWSRSIAIGISSLVFGLIHSDWNVAGMVQTGSMGMLLGVSYVVLGRNLWVPILAHGYADTLLLLQLYLAAD
jgi:membrane protease YdiL (CAAX protease family)